MTVRPRGGRNETEGLAGRVRRVLDYGRAVYSLLEVGGKSVIAPYAGKAGEAVTLTIDQSRLTVVDTEADLVIV